MSKIVCDICGTSYSEDEARCPICGCAKGEAAALLGEEVLNAEEVIAADVAERKIVEDFDDDFDFVDEDDDDEDDDYEDDDDDDDDDDEDEHKSNAPLVVALVLVVLALIAVSAFVLVKYFMPNVLAPAATEPSTVETTEAPAASTELTIPCESLALTSGGDIVLENEGDNWLINVMALPENTTDALVYASSDEAVVIVNEQGKLTAVGEGTAVITISCGQQELKCTVTCDFTQETTAPSEPEETVDPSAPSDPSEATEPEETEVPDETTVHEEKTGVITATTLNIRKTPDPNGEIVGIYAKGKEVTILEVKTVDGTEWGRTDRGWISMKFVELDN